MGHFFGTPRQICEQKIQFPEKIWAQAYIITLRENVRNEREPYHCPEGNHWHIKTKITSDAKRKRKAKHHCYEALMSMFIQLQERKRLEVE